MATLPQEANKARAEKIAIPLKTMGRIIASSRHALLKLLAAGSFLLAVSRSARLRNS
jgi:hypothetical protein